LHQHRTTVVHDAVGAIAKRNVVGDRDGGGATVTLNPHPPVGGHGVLGNLRAARRGTDTHARVIVVDDVVDDQGTAPASQGEGRAARPRAGTPNLGPRDRQAVIGRTRGRINALEGTIVHLQLVKLDTGVRADEADHCRVHAVMKLAFGDLDRAAIIEIAHFKKRIAKVAVADGDIVAVLAHQRITVGAGHGIHRELVHREIADPIDLQRVDAAHGELERDPLGLVAFDARRFIGSRAPANGPTAGVDDACIRAPRMYRILPGTCIQARAAARVALGVVIVSGTPQSPLSLGVSP
jgi:hypothetical protein